ncbi:MAG TPA: hypothetical protein VK117_14985, partial [Pyrinomonadaceae bacterium]|nr:hypothetical protein [Pyrinomonadaceae bacterium]
LANRKKIHRNDLAHNKSLDASGGSASRNLLAAAKGASIRPVEIVKLISRGQLNRYESSFLKAHSYVNNSPFLPDGLPCC